MHFIHALDQLQAMLRDLAPVVRSYYEKLLEQGFTPEEALTITIAFQNALFRVGE